MSNLLNTPFLKTKWFFCLWIFAVVALFIGLFLCGFLIVTAISIIQFSFEFNFSLFLDDVVIFVVFLVLYMLYGTICALFGVAGATLRGVILCQKMEIRLNAQGWALLIGGVALLTDLFTAPTLFGLHNGILLFSQLFVAAIGLFGLGFFTGVFSNLEYKEVMGLIKRLSLASHGLYTLIVVFPFAIEDIGLEFFLIFPLYCLFLMIVYIGTRTGYQFRDSMLARLT
ncbi:MAG: hypothetical protein AYK19_19990 [Theionarchaea archaeon DG-70-1]|nr:MAG: hypothetical protein AYK19_19990 [Theionarchaea archaeon DG-70-1]